MATVIDSLVVLLGLDASNYKRGRETAEKETAETARKSKAAANDITKSMTEVGRTIAGLFLGFESATGLAKWLGGINAGEAALGRTAANIGMGAHELNKWGNAAELAGSSAADVQAAFVALTNDAQKFFVTGEASPLIQTLQQYGVNLKNANGTLRNQGDIFEELADKTAVYGREYQNFALKQAGLSQGEINYLAQAKSLRQDQLAQAERDNAVTEETVKKAAELQQYWRNIGLQIMAAGQMILTSITPALESVFKAFGDVNGATDEFAAGLKLIGSAAIIIKNILVGIGDALGGAAAAAAAALHGDFKGAWRILQDQSARTDARNAKESSDLGSIWAGQPAAASAQTVANSASQPDASGYTPPPNSKAARYNNPGNILDSRTGQENFYATPEEGEAALEHDLAKKMQRGLRTVDAIITAYEGNDNVHNNIPAYIADVRRKLGKNDLSETDIKALAQAIAIHESGPTPGIVAGRTDRAPQPTGATTTVSVGSMIVNAPNADPRAVAEQVPAALQRKFTLQQSDSGQS